MDADFAGDFVNVVFQPLLDNPRAPMATGIVSVPVFHIQAISISKSLYLKSFSTTLTDVFLSDGTAISMIWHFWFSDYDIWFISRYFPISMNWHTPTKPLLVRSLQQFLVCARTICQLSWCHSCGTPSNGYMMVSYRAFRCIPFWQVGGRQACMMWSTDSTNVLHILQNRMVLSLMLLLRYNLHQPLSLRF